MSMVFEPSEHVTDEDFREVREPFELADVEEQRDRDFFDTFLGFSSVLGSWLEFERVADEARRGLHSRSVLA